MLFFDVGGPRAARFVLTLLAPFAALCLAASVLWADSPSRVSWSFLSSSTGDLPPTNGGLEQTSCVVADVDGDGDTDFFIAERTATPSVILYRRDLNGWATYVIDHEQLPIEAGGDAADIDGDGDLDLAFGEDASGGRSWWWENPFPALDPGTPWQRHIIKNASVRQQHDQRFGDFDGDGRLEFATWVNRADRVEIYEIPENPADSPWALAAQIPLAGEGMDVIDMDLDGTVDLLAGGAWIRHEGAASYSVHIIDPNYTGVRIVGGQFIPGGWPEVVMNSGDANGPLNFYRRDGDSWQKTTLIGHVIHGHTLEVGDVDADGHLDFFAAEMGNPGAGADATGWMAWGDGTGNFALEAVTTGLGHHMSRLADLDGDGDLDIVIKPYSFNAPRIDVLLNNLPALSLTNWIRHLIDPSLPDVAVFVEAADLNGDGNLDLVAGAHWWQNPGSLAGGWTRQPVAPGFNNLVTIQDFDGDGDSDLLGTQGAGSQPNHTFLWAGNDGAGNFSPLDNIQSGGGGDFLQGRLFGVFQGGERQVVLSWHNGGGGLQALTVPADPLNQTWTFQTLSSTTQQEDLSAGDIDGDGLPDLLLGTVWLKNGGNSWVTHTLGTVSDLGGAEPDRNDLADVDGDGDLDAVVALENGVQVLWFENPRPENPVMGPWARRLIGSVAGGGFSMDTRDLDGDGDPDLVLGEHRGIGVNRVMIFQNPGLPENWPVHVVDSQPTRDADHHDGTQLIDMDGDGDLDIVSIGWTNPKLWIYENTSRGGASQPPDPLQGPLLFHYAFEDPPGTNAVSDSSVNEIGASLQGGAARTGEGHTGNAVQFDGATGRIELDPFDPTGTALTLALWFKPDHLAISDARLISRAFGVEESEHFFMLSTAPIGGEIGLRFRLKTTVGGTTALLGEGPPLTAGVWTHVAATYDGAAMRLYQNGSLVGSVAKTGPLANAVGVRTWIGANPDGTRHFAGAIDEVRCYSVALGAAEIHQLTAAGPPAILEQPEDLTVVHGRSASFQVFAAGSVPLSYQWRRDGLPITGATEPVLAVPSASVAADNLAGFDVVVANAEGSSTSRLAILTVVLPEPRVTSGLVALYGFTEGSGTRVHDASGVGSPMDLSFLDPSRIAWLPNQGVRIASPGSGIRSFGPATKLHEALTRSGQLTIEAWLTPADLAQSGPARILTVSEGTLPDQVNLHVGQGGSGGSGGSSSSGEVGDFRIRTTGEEFSWLQAEDVFISTSVPRHVLVTYDGQAQRMYVDGILRGERSLSGELSNWHPDYPLVLANEATLDRPWLGSLYLVAIYDRALSAEETLRNFSAGPGVGGPRLLIERSGQSLRLSWPAFPEGYVLEERPDLTTGDWIPTIDSPVVEGERRVVVREAAGGAAFFRLHHPGPVITASP